MTDMLDALLQMPRMYGADISPDGRWAAWSWIGVGENIDVWAAPTDGSLPPVRMTENSEETVFVAWLPDSSGLLVKQDTGGNERDGLYRVNLSAPREMIPLTDPTPDYFLRGGEFTPDGRYLVYAANLDLITGDEIEQTCVIRHDLETGERVELARPRKGGFVFPFVSPNGQYVLYNRIDRAPGGIQLWLCTLDGSSDVEIINAGDDKKAFGQWMPDSRHILFTAETATHVRIGLFDIVTGNTRWLIDDPSRTISDASIKGVPGAKLVTIVETKDAKAVASLLDPDSGIETPIPPVPGTLIPLAPSGDGLWIALTFSSKQPTDLVLCDPFHPDPETYITVARVWDYVKLTREDLTQAEDFRWKSVDGREIQGWLYRTQTVPARGTILYVHGGPTAHASDTVQPEVQYYAAHGFNVLVPNYRGSTGFTFEFQESIKIDGWGGREQDDVAHGAKALIDAGIALPGKIGVTGTSYGGYTSWHQITHTPVEWIAAAAPVCGMTDLVVDYETTRPDLRPYSEEMMGGRPDQVPEKYQQASPVNFVANIKGRLMIVQGLNDPNVTPDNVRTVQTALDAAGVEYELLAFDDEGHGIMRPANQRKLFPALAHFFESAFGG
ncbi:MAG: S9 family peptidase [Chloroflexi bacterium]|nr:S9 family peptidase [Chloroflexota bacterium]